MSDCYFLCKDHDTCFPNNSDESNIICSESCCSWYSDCDYCINKDECERYKISLSTLSEE